MLTPHESKFKTFMKDLHSAGKQDEIDTTKYVAWTPCVLSSEVEFQVG